MKHGINIKQKEKTKKPNKEERPWRNKKKKNQSEKKR